MIRCSKCNEVISGRSTICAFCGHPRTLEDKALYAEEDPVIYSGQAFHVLVGIILIGMFFVCKLYLR